MDEIRRRAESCDPETAEAKGLQLWLASGGKEREGLTDTDILRFIMFRFLLADASFADVDESGQKAEMTRRGNKLADGNRAREGYFTPRTDK